MSLWPTEFASKFIKFLTFLILFFQFFQALAVEAVPVELIRTTKKVSLVFVGSKKGLSESSFGHIALRFSPGEELGAFDTNIQFVANLPQKEFFLKKYAKGFGIFGDYAYDVQIELNSFTNYKSIKIKEEDRDVYVLPLSLTPHQIARLVDYIETFYDEGVKKYRFFNKNCSWYAADALEYAVERDLMAKSFPWKVGDHLKKIGLATDEIYHPSHTNFQKELVKKLYSSNSKALLESYKSETAFNNDLQSENLNIKSDSYFTIIAALKDLQAHGESEELSQLKDDYLALAAREEDQVQAYFKAILKNFDAIEIKRISQEIYSSEPRPNFPKSLNSEIIMRRKSPAIEVNWSQSTNHTRDSVQLKLSFLNYNERTGAITYNDQNVGYHLITRKDNWVSATGINYSLSLNSFRRSIKGFVVIFKNNASPKESWSKITQKRHLALNNMVDFDNTDSLGACLAMVKLQKAFYERVIFNEEANWDTEIDKLEVIKKVISGEFVIIPGYANIFDFTASIDKEKLISFVSELQNGLNSNPRKAFFDGLFQYQEIKRKTFKNLVFLLNAGHAVELIIGMKKQGSRRYEQVSHVVLVHDIKTRDDNRGWDLSIYDPNLGHIVVQLKEDFTIKFPSIYRSDLIYNGVLYKKIKGAIDFDLGMRSLNLNEQKLIKRSRRGRPLFYNPLNYSY
jgi:hypothetical protein